MAKKQEVTRNQTGGVPLSGHGKGGTLVGQVPWSVSAKRAQRQNGLGLARSLPAIGYSAIYIKHRDTLQGGPV